MKMKYVKPTVIVERFTLTQNIATNCGPRNNVWGYANHWGKASCAWILPDGVTKPWVEASERCEEYFGADESIEGLCYNNPNGGIQIFAS